MVFERVRTFAWVPFAVVLLAGCPALAGSLNLGPEQIVQAGGSDLTVNGYSVPDYVDWNSDGRMDLIVGEGSGNDDGKIRVYLNGGTSAAPSFSDFFYVQVNGADLVVPGERSSPVVTDADGDGRKDLLVGNTDGQLLLYSNRGTDAAPLFDTYSYITADGVAIDLPGSPRSRPFVADWTGDGFSDVLIGAADGKVHLYQGIPEPASPLSIAMGVPFLLKRPRR